jgi:dihydrofolate synthase/folylpolyglutamate synthase
MERRKAMSEAWDYKRALEELWRRSSYERGLISDPFGDIARAELGLQRMRALLERLGDPHLQPRTVHIAGSKGKGSTSTFIASAAREAGHRVGLYTSPHLHRFPERVAIDGQPLPDAEFAANARLVAEAAATLEAERPELDTITTFEFVTAMAFVAFARARCDLAVIEVGLGGRYDATNVLSPAATVITRLDLEHTAVLGPTYADIAYQKAGIMQPGVPAISAPQVAEAETTLIREASRVGAPLLLGGRDWSWQGTWQAFTARGPWGEWTDLLVGMPGPHQVENACVAIATLHGIDKGGVAISERAIRAGLAAARSPGRFELVAIDDRRVVFDGAHTPAAAAALVATWHDELGERPATVILGMGADKPVTPFLAQLRPIVGRLLATRSDSPRAADPGRIVAAATELGIPAETYSTVAEAVAAALAGERGALLITGSLFVAGEGREALGLAAPDEIWRTINDAHLARTDAGKRT